MNVVNISGVEPGFFATVAIFLLFILSMLSMGVLRLFQLRKRSGAYYFVAGAAGIVAFVAVLSVWYA
ncbi:hypothetical protein [Paenibacillus flagellatus]|uniref:Uncharacterized protein n=1 Tax=Paenibacillus flagellatus TaxID=2211139 RepID=A0A2V5KYN7_9BACL|nr:hypothetical protein [Paenibacillus flagellatus]PYI55116.1 hypothetical protein DLM86_11345 [Paenibacillus flagellatus]